MFDPHALQTEYATLRLRGKENSEPVAKLFVNLMTGDWEWTADSPFPVTTYDAPANRSISLVGESRFDDRFKLFIDISPNHTERIARFHPNLDDESDTPLPIVMIESDDALLDLCRIVIDLNLLDYTFEGMRK